MYRCGQCGGHGTWHPARRQVVCHSCGGVIDLPPADGSPATSLFLLPLLRDSPANVRAFTRDRVEKRCPTCASVVVFAAGIEGAQCDACQTPLLRPPESSEAPVRPTGVVPFRITADQARDNIGAWWRKTQRRRRLDLAELQGRYVPVWQFSVHVHCPWRATTTSTDSQGTQRTEVRSGEVRGDYGEREPATRHLPVSLMPPLPFPFDAAVAFDPRYLAGALVEQYEVGLWDAWDAAQERLTALVHWLVRKDAGLMTLPDEQWPRWSNEKVWLILVPYYTATVSTGSRTYEVFVDGSRGTISTDVPRHPRDRLAGLVMLAGVAIAAMTVLWGVWRLVARLFA